MQDRVFAFPEFVCFVPDERLGALISHLPTPLAEVSGELLFRLWLYKGVRSGGNELGLANLPKELSELLEFVEQKVIPSRAGALEEHVFAQRREELERMGKKQCLAEQFFTRRVKAFRRAAGIIPVVSCDQKCAFPVPFEITSDIHLERTVTDARGNSIPVWEDEIRSLWKIVGKHRLVVPMDLGNAGADLRLTGGSLALPVALAVRYQCESGHDPLQVLATGAVQDGRLRQVAGCEAKGVLARKMGARLWLFPGNDEEAVGIGAPRRICLPEEDLAVVLNRVHSLLQEEGLAKLDVSKALRLLVSLRLRSATGRFPVKFLIDQVQRCLEVFIQDNNPALQCEAIPEARILLAALENHAGRAGRAAEMLEVVAESAANDRRIGSKIIPYRVVSFTDMGRLDDAEMWGEKALEWAMKLPEDREGLEARIQASGSLGGDALLQKALRKNDEKLALRSRCLLEKNREWAVQLHSYYTVAEHRDDRNWAAMSASRVALWHAFFQPQDIATQVALAGERIRQVLGQAPPQDSSSDYLLRTALLGDFRTLISKIAEPVTRWELPSSEAPHWVQATALKYRAAILASHGEFDAASRDFLAAYELLHLDPAPLIQTIGWSIAAQAVVSLREKAATQFSLCLRENRQYVVNYLSGYSYSPSLALAQVFDAGEWTYDHLAEFQRGFAY